MPKANNDYKISRGKTLIEVPHEGSNITFGCKLHGPDSYACVGMSILMDGLARPTMAQTASLLHAAYLSKQIEPEFSLIKSKLERNLLWAFTGWLYVPAKGIYIEDNPKTPNRMPTMNESELIKKLEASDKSARFVPFGFLTGEMTPRELAKNHYLIRLAGEEGAEKLAEVSAMFKDKPALHIYYSGSQNSRVSALLSINRPGHQGLGIFCCYAGQSEFGRALGVER